MKKLILSMAVALMAGTSAYSANPVTNNPDNKGYFGLRLGADITCPGSVKASPVSVSMFKNGGGVEFGGIYNISVVANFYIEPGVKLFVDQYSVKKDWLDSGVTGMSVSKFGFRIPVMFGYHFDFSKDFKLYVFTGPELETGLVGRETVKAKNVKVSEDIYSEEGGMQRVNFLWGLGAGVSYKKVYFSVGGGFGMVNMLKDADGTTFHENRATISLGYNF